MSNKVRPEVSSIEVRAAQPKAADSRKIQYICDIKNRSAEDIVYIVKLYMDDVEPFYTSAGLRLFVGDHEIKEYSGFKNGIYFKVYDPDFLAENGGEMVRFTADGVEFIDTGVRLPSAPAGVGLAATAGLATELPSQDQVLAE